ncbi:MAG: redox-regulated ATPase YchF [Candidatus Pacebacteria bacterium]|nr:redox-regulated ATPase YchF [Candidatus Paceibacterota bacterium]
MASLQVGIVGLPNAGKSTLFNALLKKQVADTTNYPFCTIEPNKGIVEVPDGRLPVLAEIVRTQKIIPAVVEFIDIAGLVRGAHQGEGLGNQFLAQIREVAVISQVVRLFKNPDVAHVEKRLNPKADVEIVNSELILADLQTLMKQKEPRISTDKEALFRWQAIQKLKRHLDQGLLAREVSLTPAERELTKDLCLLTAKPMIYVANVGEDNLAGAVVDFDYQPVIKLSAKLEESLILLPKKEQLDYLAEYGLSEAGLSRLIKTAYETLGLISFLTAGEKEVRAWTIRKGMRAQEAAGVIHTDFAQKFIKAEVISFEDFVQDGGWANCRSLGKVRLEGRDYQIKDGEVVDFKIGA